MVVSVPERLRHLSRACAGVVVMVVAASWTAPVSAQDDAPAEPKVIPTIRTHIYDRLAAAQACLDEGDVECATEELDRVGNQRDLNNYEVAQLWNFRAYVFFEQDDVDGAVEAYEMILSLPFEDMPDGMIQQSMRNLATLYLEIERYDQGLTTFLRYLDLPTVMPSPSDYYLLATIYYQLDRYADGVPAVRQAIQMANDNGSIGEEAWYQLLYVFYFQLEQTDDLIDTLTFMVEHWTKWQWMRALAGQLSGQDRQEETLSLYEAAYEAGYLKQGGEQVQLANLYLNHATPYKAAVILQEGLDSGLIESTVENWRRLATAWQYAAEHEKALPALDRASRLSDNGEVDAAIAQSMSRLARWEECIEAGRSAIERGGLRDPGYANLQLGQCLLNIKRYDEARVAFQAAARDDRTERDARRFLQFIDIEVARERANAEALASVQP